MICYMQNFFFYIAYTQTQTKMREKTCFGRNTEQNMIQLSAHVLFNSWYILLPKFFKYQKMTFSYKPRILACYHWNILDADSFWQPHYLSFKILAHNNLKQNNKSRSANADQARVCTRPCAHTHPHPVFQRNNNGLVFFQK